MSAEKEKYDELIKLLRKSSPEFPDKEGMADKVMGIIESSRQKVNQSETIFDYLFWWVHIGWVRRSLVIASILLIMVFGYQQTVILKRLSDLNRQPVITSNQMVVFSTLKFSNDFSFMVNYEDINSENLKITDRRVRKLLKSYEEITEKYKELRNILEEDPELMKYLEENLNSVNKNKIKL
jgi:hypothetical protein